MSWLDIHLVWQVQSWTKWISLYMGLDLAIACDVMTEVVPLQTYSEALDKALKLEVFFQKMY